MQLSRNYLARGVYLGFIILVALVVGYYVYPFTSEHPGVMSAQSWAILVMLFVSAVFWWMALQHEGRHEGAVLVASVAVIGLMVGGFLFVRHAWDVSCLALIVAIGLGLLALALICGPVLGWIGGTFAEMQRSPDADAEYMSDDEHLHAVPEGQSTEEDDRPTDAGLALLPGSYEPSDDTGQYEGSTGA